MIDIATGFNKKQRATTLLIQNDLDFESDYRYPSVFMADQVRF